MTWLEHGCIWIFGGKIGRNIYEFRRLLTSLRYGLVWDIY